MVKFLLFLTLLASFSSCFTLEQYSFQYQSAFTATAGCTKFSCKLSNQTFTDETCLFFDVPSSTFYANPCKDPNKICQPGSPSGNWTCNNPVNPQPNYWPGEKCNSNSECNSIFTTGCSQGVCQGTKIGETCYNNNQCVPGASCQSKHGNNICYPLIPAGHVGCVNDYDCAYNSACNITSSTNSTLNTCLRLKSVSPGQQVGSCVSNYNGLCAWQTCASNGQVNICTNPITSPSQIPIACSQSGPGSCSSVADSFTGYQIQGVCQCAFNSNAQGYCQTFPADTPELQALNQTITWLNSEAVKKCNTLRRNLPNNLICAAEYWERSNYIKLVNALYNESDYIYGQGASDCVKKTLLPGYLALQNTKESANWLRHRIEELLNILN